MKPPDQAQPPIDSFPRARPPEPMRAEGPPNNNKSPTPTRRYQDRLKSKSYQRSAISVNLSPEAFSALREGAAFDHVSLADFAVRSIHDFFRIRLNPSGRRRRAWTAIIPHLIAAEARPPVKIILL